MLAKLLVPCIDLDSVRVVNGLKYLSIRYAGDPFEAAIRYDAEGPD